MNFDQAVDRVLDQFDVTQADAERIVADTYGRMVTEAEYITYEQALTATTVAGQLTYNLAAGFPAVDIRWLEIGGEIYEAIGTRKMRELLNGTRSISGRGGVFALRNQDQIDIFPIPASTGLSILTVGSVGPVPFTYGAATNFAIPGTFTVPLWDGIQAAAYLEADERPDMADYHDQRFQTGIAELIRYKNKRLGGPSDRRIQVAGYDY